MLLQAVGQEAPNNHLTRKQWFMLDNTSENVGAVKCTKQLQVKMKYEPTRNQHFLFW
jgi:hypothetical protein